MQNNVQSDFQRQLDAVFAQLNPQAVEEFYVAYQQWNLQQRITGLRQRIDAVRAQQADNEQRLRETQPSAIALAALARLQSNGVSDIALLDAMLERGESWLDQTMQRLDYFEQFEDFISDDYTKWCQGALEGAFDWIDSLREETEQAASLPPETPPVQVPSNSEDAGEVEALLLQRLATEKEEDDLSWQEAITLKRPAINPPPQETITSAPEEQEPPAPEHETQQNVETRAQATEEYIPLDEPAQSDETPIASDAASSTSAEEQIIPEEVLPIEVTALSEPEPDPPALVEFAPTEEPAPDEDELHAGDHQPALVESAPIEQPSPPESEPHAGDEQPAFVEFAAPSEVSPAEETSDRPAEQAAPTEITMPEDTLTGEDMAQSEANQAGVMENSASEAASPYNERAPSSNQAARPAQSVPRKGGLMRRMIRFLAGV